MGPLLDPLEAESKHGVRETQIIGCWSSQSGRNFQMKTLTQWSWLPDCGISFVNWLLLRFQCITMLFAALRQENFDRWRHVGTKGLHFDYNHLDDEDKVRPICTSEYPRVKLKNGCNPYKVEETQQMVIVCFCKGPHRPITSGNHRPYKKFRCTCMS